jgi:amidohydrolase
MDPITPMDEAELVALYRDLHQHPELSFQETRTAAIVADRLAALGYDVTTGDGGPGPTVLLRADMDALPVLERTGLEFASAQRGVDRHGADVPVMHACGHDVHVTCLLGAASVLATERQSLSGRLVLVFQPAEELGAGAEAMIADRFFDRFGRPDVVLGQHVAPMPAGLLGLHPGTAMAASDSLTITFHGSGGHGSRPETTVDPVVMAASAVLRLQTVVSRETATTETAVVTVGVMRAGSTANVIPDTAEIQVNVRTTDPGVRERTLGAITRIVNAEAEASAAPRPPQVDHTDAFPALHNDPDATERVRRAFADVRTALVVDPGVVTGSEDVGRFAVAAGAPCVYWFLGGADPTHFAGAATVDEIREVVRGLPSNHSPEFAPVLSPTLTTGVEALVAAARAWGVSVGG